jgi:predicted MarR family transcription regulator
MPEQKSDPKQKPLVEAMVTDEKTADHARAIVSSRHLASEQGWQMSEFEYGLILSFNAFNRWMVRCMAASGQKEMSPLDILVLHNINHRSRDKRLSDICFMLNIEDTHLVNYAVKKLLKAGLVVGEKHGKEMFYATSETGAQLCETYRQVREECLLSSMKNIGLNQDEIRKVASMMRSLSGIYDQASRAASSL